MLYNVFLHEVGHLQLVDEAASSTRRRFAHEKLAQSFALTWAKRLLSEQFSHPDPVHNAPTPAELAAAASKVSIDEQTQ
jgi:hypothetical protein